MKKIILAVAISALAGGAYAQSSSDAGSQSASDAGAFASTGSITFEAAEQRRSQRIHTTPNVYAPPSMFGHGSCGKANTGAVSITSVGVGGSRVKDDPACEARADTAVAAQLGLMDVARLRFFCYGMPANKDAYLASGATCPEDEKIAAANNEIYSGNDPIVRARLGLD